MNHPLTQMPPLAQTKTSPNNKFLEHVLIPQRQESNLSLDFSNGRPITN